MKKRKLLVGLLSIFMLTAALGVAGCEGVDGKDGKSAYQIWLDLGNTGTEEDFLAWLKGDQGEKGEDGLIPFIGENGNWWIGDIDTGIGATGEQGPQGDKGEKGDQGESAVDHDGTEGLEFYPINDTECAVSVGKAQLLKEIVIPSKYKGYTVATVNGQSIGGGFASCTNLEKITLPDTIMSIGDDAFWFCSSLTNVVIPDSVTSIGEAAFAGCSSLTSVVFGDSVTSIGERAFAGCSSLTSVVIPDGVTSIGWCAFDNCSSLTGVYITDIAAWCNISGLYNLTDYGSSSKSLYLNNELVRELVIPDGVTSIGYKAFEYCSSLTSVVIPDSVTSIGEAAFQYCSSLTSVVIPDSVTSIGSSAFDNCSSLQYNEKNGLKYLGNSNNPYLYLAGVEDKTITTATIDNNCKFIGDDAFDYCDSLTSVVIPDSVTSIGDGAFWFCSSLTNVVIPDSVTSIGGAAFAGCSSLTSVVIPDGVTSIGYYAFEYCYSLTIYCEAESQPSGWASYWNCSNRPVVWGYQG